jgi:hypothetical protein
MSSSPGWRQEREWRLDAPPTCSDLQTLSRFYRIGLEGSDDQWRLLLAPASQKKMRATVREIRISGSKNRIRTIEILEAEGDRSVMTIAEEAP